jgi:hypothetical protein
MVDDPAGVAIQILSGMTGDSERAEEEVFQRVAKWVHGKLEERMLPEDQRKVKVLQRELAKREALLEDHRRQAESEEAKVAQDAALAEADKEISVAFEKSSLPSTPENARRMLKIWQEHEDAEQSVTLLEAAELVKTELEQDELALLSRLSPEDLETRAPDLLKKVQAHSLAKARRSTQPLAMTGARSTSTPSTKSGAGRNGAKKSIPWHDIFD